MGKLWNIGAQPIRLRLSQGLAHFPSGATNNFPHRFDPIQDQTACPFLSPRRERSVQYKLCDTTSDFSGAATSVQGLGCAKTCFYTARVKNGSVDRGSGTAGEPR